MISISIEIWLSCTNIDFRNLTEFSLKNSITISNQIEFKMIGNANRTRIYCSNASGVTLNNVNIEFYGCGELQFYANESITAAIRMFNCSNIYIMNISFYGSYGTAVVLINSSGFVQMKKCLFYFGRIHDWKKMASNGGGGIHIQQTPASNISVNVTVTDSEFFGNRAVGTHHPFTCNTSCRCLCQYQQLSFLE